MEQLGHSQSDSLTSAHNLPPLFNEDFNHYNGPDAGSTNNLMVESPVASKAPRKSKPHTKDSRAERARQTYAQRKTLRCRWCSQKHSCKFNLEQHERVHTKEKPFTCEQCQQPFGRQWLLTRHMKSKHGIDKEGRPTRKRASSHEAPNNEDVDMGTPQSDNHSERIPNDAEAPQFAYDPFDTESTPAPPEGALSFTPQPDFILSTFPTNTTTNNIWNGQQLDEEDVFDVRALTDKGTPLVWSVLVAQPPPPEECIIVCGECGFTGNYGSVAELQEHRHQVHIIPSGYACGCSYCTGSMLFSPVSAEDTTHDGNHDGIHDVTRDGTHQITLTGVAQTDNGKTDDDYEGIFARFTNTDMFLDPNLC